MNSDKWRIDACPPATKERKSVVSNGPKLIPNSSLMDNQMLIELLQNIDDIGALIFGDPAPLFHKSLNMRIC